MLGYLAIQAVILPLLRQGRAQNRAPSATHTKSAMAEVGTSLPPMPATDVAATPSVAGSVAQPVALPLLHVDVAIEHYCREMVAGWGGSELEVATVHSGYAAMCAVRGWPDVSVKVLSQGLVRLGCKRQQLDLRRTGEGRPTVLVFPRALVSASRPPAKPRKRKKGSRSR